MSRRTPPESIAWLHHAAAAGQADARLMLTMLERLEALEAHDREDANCWASVRASMLHLRERIEALEAAQREAAMDELRKASAELQSAPESSPVAGDDEPQTLHTIALKMVDTLEQLRVLPEILDTLRRAIREPMQQPTPEAAPAATDDDLLELATDRFPDGLRVCYNLGREHGALAAAQLAPPAAPIYRYSPVTIAECGGPCEQGPEYCDCGQIKPEYAQPAQPAAPAPAGGLLERVALAIGGDGDHPANWTPEARRAIREVAAWLDTRGQHGCSLWLREEAGRG